MKTALLVVPVLFSALLAAGCGATRADRWETSTVLLEQEGAEVRMLLEVGSEAYRVHWIAARAAGDVALRGVDVVLFVDVDGDGVPGESERLGTWHATSAEPTHALEASAMAGPAWLGPRERERLGAHVTVEVIAAGVPSTLTETRPLS